VSGAVAELVTRGVGALRRSGLWWGSGIVGFAVVNLAFWPSLEGSEALTNLGDMSEGLLEAFGAQNIATPAGYLDGQMYALLLPLLLSGMAIAGVTAITSGDEDAGRLELLHALPVSRRAVWLSRYTAALAVLATVAVVTGALVASLLGVFSLEEVGAGRVAAATLACALLAAFHAAIGYAAGGAGYSRGVSAGVAVGVLVVGYVVDFLLPLSDTLAGGAKVSPWYWAIGTQPVSDGLNPGLLALLVAVTVGLVALGTAAVERRDIRSA
jgi:ABC-2 type transport system permease protein